MSSELQFERLTKAAVAFSYMSSVAKVRIFLHIPMLFADYLMDSLLFFVRGLDLSLLVFILLRITFLSHNLEP